MAIPSEYEYILNINSLYTKDYGDSTHYPDIYENDTWHSGYSDGPIAQVNNRDYTLVSIGSAPFYSGNCNYHIANSAIYNTGDIKFAPFSPAYAEINVDQSQDGYTITYPDNFINDNPYQYPQGMRGVELGKDPNIGFFYLSVDYGSISLRTDFSNLSSAIAYIYAMFSNIVLYVDGEKWIDDRPVLYNWTSVPSITGKNGIISLAQIASDSINDGEPVSDAAVTAFSDLPAECNVGEIIDELLPYEESLVDVLVKYKVKGAVTGAFEYVKLVAKKGSIPKSVEDGDKVVDINPSKKSKLVTGLDEGSKYYFVIFEKDSAGQTAQSNEKSIRTGDLPDGTIFEYTGEIQTFVAPKTGIYQLETWGAQGGDATDGTNTARGGYGAYAVGEVFLTQGDTLYINVGGQNGYGGGGHSYTEQTLESVVRNNDFLTHVKESQRYGDSQSIFRHNNVYDLPDARHDDWSLLAGTNGRLAMTVSNGIYTLDGRCNNNVGDMSTFGIPVKVMNCKQIQFEYKFNNANNYPFIRFGIYNVNSENPFEELSENGWSTVVTGIQKTIQNTPAVIDYVTISWASSFEITTGDTNWHTVTISRTDGMDIDFISICSCAELLNIRNMKFLCDIY